MLRIEGKVHEQIIEKLGQKPLTWGHVHAVIDVPKDLKELMTTLRNLKWSFFSYSIESRSFIRYFCIVWTIGHKQGTN